MCIHVRVGTLTGNRSDALIAEECNSRIHRSTRRVESTSFDGIPNKTKKKENLEIFSVRGVTYAIS